MLNHERAMTNAAETEFLGRAQKNHKTRLWVEQQGCDLFEGYLLSRRFRPLVQYPYCELNFVRVRGEGMHSLSL